MLANIEILFSRDSSRNHSHVILGRFLTLQAYLDPWKGIASLYGFGFEIAGIFSPL